MVSSVTGSLENVQFPTLSDEDLASTVVFLRSLPTGTNHLYRSRDERRAPVDPSQFRGLAQIPDLQLGPGGHFHHVLGDVQ
jgi:hypothetical protein